MLANADRAIIEPAKVRDYLLSAEHPIGRFKARFFHALGYRQDDWEALRDDLLCLGVLGDAKPGQPSPHGKKYEAGGTLTGPNGRTAALMSIWLLRTNEDAPRFVIAYPG